MAFPTQLFEIRDAWDSPIETPDTVTDWMQAMTRQELENFWWVEWSLVDAARGLYASDRGEVSRIAWERDRWRRQEDDDSDE